MTSKERRVRDSLGYVGLTIAVLLTSSMAYSEWLADQKHVQQIRAMSERDKAEAALRDSLEIGYVIVNHKGVIVEFNPYMQELTGIATGDAIGSQLADIVPEAMRGKHLEAFQKAIGEAADPSHVAKPAKLIECSLPDPENPDRKIPLRIGVSIVKSNVNGSKPYVIAKVNKARDTEVIKPGS